MNTVCFLLLVLAVAQAPQRDRPAPPPGAGKASIAGRITVTDSKPVAPVRRARVTLTGGDMAQPEIVDTDVDGRYRFVDLPPGTYRLTASKPGFVTVERPASIELTGEQSASIDVSLPRGAAIDGQIRNDAGEPVVDVVVQAVRFTHVSTAPRVVVIRETRTDDRGRYRLHSLPEGHYFVQASPEMRTLELYSISTGERGPGLARTYFPGVAQVHEARRISLAAGREAAGTDFTIATVPLARLVGRVLDSTGKAPAMPAWGVRLRAVNGLPVTSGGYVFESGTFNMGHVPPGDYWLMVTAQPAPGAVTEFAATRLTFAGQDVSDLTLTTAPGVVLVGRLEAEAGALPAVQGVRVTPQWIDLEFPPTRTAAPPVTVAADGSFKINGIFGPKLIRLTGLPPAWALKAVMLDDVDITDAPTDFRGSNAPRALRMVVTDKTGSVSGTVWTGERQASAYHAVVFAADERTWREGSRFTRVVPPREDGGFTVHGLLPGEYLVAAVPSIDEGAANDPEFLRALRDAAARVTVAEGGKPSIKVQMKGAR